MVVGLVATRCVDFDLHSLHDYVLYSLIRGCVDCCNTLWRFCVVFTQCLCVVFIVAWVWGVCLHCVGHPIDPGDAKIPRNAVHRPRGDPHSEPDLADVTGGALERVHSVSCGTH